MKRNRSCYLNGAEPNSTAINKEETKYDYVLKFYMYWSKKSSQLEKL